MNMYKSVAIVALSLAGITAGYSQGQGSGGDIAAQQAALDKSYPQLNVSDHYMHLAIPGYTMGETMGVATNSKGHLFVYSRTNPQGIARGGQAAMLWEFDQNGKFV